MHEKSRPKHEDRKPAKTLKERRAEKRAAHEAAAKPATVIPKGRKA
jgi:hypothetical protein